jgi:hypothetical protein
VDNEVEILKSCLKYGRGCAEVREQRFEAGKRFVAARGGNRGDLDSAPQPFGRYDAAVDARHMRRCGRFGHEHVFAPGFAQHGRQARRRPVAVALNVHDCAAREVGNHGAELLVELPHAAFDQYDFGVLQRFGDRVADRVQLRESGALRHEMLRIPFDQKTAALANFGQLCRLLGEYGVAHFVAGEREIRRADGADRARGVADDCDFRHAVLPCDVPGNHNGFGGFAMPAFCTAFSAAMR